MKNIFFKMTVCLTISIVLLLLTKSHQLDPNIENSWTDYSYGSKEKRIKQINLPLQYETVMIFLSQKDGQLVALEDHEKTWHFDDIGYMLFSQIAVYFFGYLTLHDLALFQNTLFLLSCLFLTLVVCYQFNSSVLAILVFVVLLGVRMELEPHIYSSVSQHSIITVLPVTFIALTLLGAFLFENLYTRGIVFCYGFFVSAIASIFALIRWPVGMACFLTIVVMGLFWKTSVRFKIAYIWVCIVGFVFIMNLMIGVIALKRDKKLGWYEGFSVSYFMGPPKHKPFFSLLAGIGRYPNSLGLVYNDSQIDKYLIERYGGTEYEKLFNKHAMKEYFGYVYNYPFEYAMYLARGLSEMVFVIPAITFQHTNFFVGAPLITGSIENRVDKSDRHFSAGNYLLNLRLRYIDIDWWEWVLYSGALLSLFGGFIVSFEKFSREKNYFNSVFIGLVVFLLLLGIPRILIPVWGQDFVVCFWTLSAIGLVFLLHQYKLAMWNLLLRIGRRLRWLEV
jgi:hypothetical protein